MNKISLIFKGVPRIRLVIRQANIYLKPKVNLHLLSIPFLGIGEWYFKCV